MSNFDLGDFLSLLIVFVVYLSAASGKKKKGKQKRRSPMRSRAQGEQRDHRAKARDEQTFSGFEHEFAEDEQMHARTCDMQPIHLHEVSQKQFAAAQEGEDPCHAGGMEWTKELRETDFESEEADTIAQDVLRGVIMSEILTRPQERAVLRRGRR